MIMNAATDITVKWFQSQSLGRVEERISGRDNGRVFYEGTTWPARFYDLNYQGAVEVEAWVEVLGREGLTLLVSPVVNRAVAAPLQR